MCIIRTMKTRIEIDTRTFVRFWLVVIGKLSMVGPYPLRPEDADQLSDAARIRYDVRPGVTGNWRVARRSTVTLDDVLVQDATYLRTWSPLQDLKIVTMTIGRMLWGRSRNLEIKSSERGTR